MALEGQGEAARRRRSVIEVGDERSPPRPDDPPGLLPGLSRLLALWRQRGRATERLRQRTAQLEEANARLEAAVKDREVLLREVQHRVKNNLQVICSLLRLQSARLQTEQRHGFDESLRRIQSMSLVHDLLYRSDRPARINYAVYLRAVCDLLAHSAGPGLVEVEVSAVDWDLDVDQATPLGLIASELVANALLHAYPGGRAGCVRVSLQPVADAMLLEVTDTGVGLPEQAMARSRKRGLGLVLVEALARQVHATVTVERRGGTRFRLLIPQQPARPASAQPE